ADRLTALLPALLAIGAPAGTDGTWTDEQQKAQDRALVLPGYWQPKEELRGQADIPAEEK
ncbi:MAG: hypothetical protein LBV79_12400, partial [Candidatus Adiutrix sp.]|nr:hypothetical protein [Candidatus Adiutrix sp.]